MGAFLILRCGVRERESGMRQSTSLFFLGGGRPPQLDGANPLFVSVGGGGGDPFSWMGAFLILRCGVRERESGMRQSTSSFFSWGGGDPLSWMGAFLILRCGVRERQSGMRQSTSLSFLGGGRPPQLDGANPLFVSVGGGGRPLQLDGRILDSPVRRSRARVGNAPIHFFFFFLGGGETPSVGWAHS